MKVLFDGITKIISVTQVPVDDLITIDVQIDLYSDWKEWLKENDNAKYLPAFRSVGGDPVSGVKNLGATYFLTNGWRIRPYEADHRFILEGNLYTDPSGFSPIIPAIGAYSVIVEYSVSNLVDSTIQQLSEIQNSTYNEGVIIDFVNGVDALTFPAGTCQAPVKTLAFAKTIAVERGFEKILVHGYLTIAYGESVSNYTICGYNRLLTEINLESGCETINATFKECYIHGYGNGGNMFFQNCKLGEMVNMSGRIEKCDLSGNLTMDGDLIIYNCCSIINLPLTPEISCPNGYVLQVRNYTGGLLIKNMDNDLCYATFDFLSGRLTVTSTCAKGTVRVRGICSVTDGHTGICSVNTEGVVQTTPLLTTAKFIALK